MRIYVSACSKTILYHFLEVLTAVCSKEYILAPLLINVHSHGKEQDGEWHQQNSKTGNPGSSSPCSQQNTNSIIHRQFILWDIQKSVEKLLHPKQAQNQTHPSWLQNLRYPPTRILTPSRAQDHFTAGIYPEEAKSGS